jgi:hypothetical protein
MHVIDHMYVTNTNYTLNQLYNGVKSEAGNSFGGNWEGLTEDAWLKIVAYGFDDVDADAYAEPIDSVEFYLVQGENVVTDWQKWDLSALGEVAKVRFNFLYSDEMGGKYGFTIPGYFAYDDVAVRFPKTETALPNLSTLQGGVGGGLTAQKIIRNGQLLIIRDGKEYNMLGQ